MLLTARQQYVRIIDESLENVRNVLSNVAGIGWQEVSPFQILDITEVTILLLIVGTELAICRSEQDFPDMFICTDI